jgi:hypothetical protein
LLRDFADGFKVLATIIQNMEAVEAAGADESAPASKRARTDAA